MNCFFGGVLLYFFVVKYCFFLRKLIGKMVFFIIFFKFVCGIFIILSMVFLLLMSCIKEFLEFMVDEMFYFYQFFLGFLLFIVSIENFMMIVKVELGWCLFYDFIFLVDQSIFCNSCYK